MLDYWLGSKLALVVFPIIATVMVAIMVGIGALLRKLGYAKQLKAIEQKILPFQARVNQAFRAQAFSVLRASSRKK